MSILGTIFGSKKIMSAGMNTIDALHVSGEERAQIKLSFMGMYEAYKVAQRWLMVLLAFPFVTLHVAGFAFWMYTVKTVTDMERYKFMVIELRGMIELNNAALGEPLSWVVIFYFGGGAAEGAIKRFINNKQK